MMEGSHLCLVADDVSIPKELRDFALSGLISFSVSISRVSDLGVEIEFEFPGVKSSG